MKTLKQLNEELKSVALMEEIEAINDTGYLTEDLVTVIETHKKAKWTEGMNAADAKAYRNKLLEEAMNAGY